MISSKKYAIITICMIFSFVLFYILGNFLYEPLLRIATGTDAVRYVTTSPGGWKSSFLLSASIAVLGSIFASSFFFYREKKVPFCTSRNLFGLFFVVLIVFFGTLALIRLTLYAKDAQNLGIGVSVPIEDVPIYLAGILASIAILVYSFKYVSCSVKKLDHE